VFFFKTHKLIYKSYKYICTCRILNQKAIRKRKDSITRILKRKCHIWKFLLLLLLLER
jgi:hypothetical protein